MKETLEEEQLEKDGPQLEIKHDQAPVHEKVEYNKELELLNESQQEEEFQSKLHSFKRNLKIETDDLEDNQEKTYQIKLMSALLKNQVTPQVLNGVALDPDSKKKVKKTKQKILGLEIDINAPEYDADGNLIYEEDEDEEEPEALNGIFNAHLLDEEVLDQQVYLGSRSNSVSSSQ